MCSGQPGSIDGGQIVQLVEHLTKDSGGPGPLRLSLHVAFGAVIV